MERADYFYGRRWLQKGKIYYSKQDVEMPDEYRLNGKFNGIIETKDGVNGYKWFNGPMNVVKS